MDGSQYALVYGVRRTRGTLRAWNSRPWPVLKGWLLGSTAAAACLLLAVLLVATVAPSTGFVSTQRPPLATGTATDVLHILRANALVLALHAMACVAGFIAGSSLPLQASSRTGLSAAIHERGGAIAIAFVVAATAFSLTAQALVLGSEVSRVSATLHTSNALLLLALIPHALPELTALFLPLAAWIIASRRDQWDSLLAATLVTVAIAVPILLMTAVCEVYLAPHVLHALIAFPPR
jgi:hypothetical protein